MSVFGQLYIVPAMMLVTEFSVGEPLGMRVAGVDGVAPGSSNSEEVGMYACSLPDSDQKLSVEGYVIEGWSA